MHVLCYPTLMESVLYLCHCWLKVTLITDVWFLEKLHIEIYQVKMKLTPEILNEVFDIECPYPLKNEIWDLSHETLVL